MADDEKPPEPPADAARKAALQRAFNTIGGFILDGHLNLEEAEKGIIQACRAHNPEMSELARRLRIGRSTLYRKIEKYDGPK